ncbi:aldehyde dehydrogenase family protein [Paenibacillus aurantius]|uniref:Aldehyde dehydrogenase n=1 Tax=Paenibacillus aurantius TaxID=2918900 RepID=A0AA96LBB4_9BACL|nr:aldehyde dehydrogenase family protein [Paenibacillus aurantius]WNQ10028.1 aldehyde dehydrogenase family protein [Paenibacillus aurantius]
MTFPAFYQPEQPESNPAGPDHPEKAPYVRMMEAARNAQPDWRRLSFPERAAYVRRLRKLLIRDKEEWIGLLGEEGAKTPMDALFTDLVTAAQGLKHYEKKAARMLRPRRYRRLGFLSERARVLQEPVGTVLLVAPWNFPLQLALVPAAAALMAGCTVLLKPSERLPRLNAKLRELLAETGFPAGVVQLAEGAREAVEGLIDAGPDKVLFTGGTEAGRSVYRRAAGRLIPCELELGGKDAMIVCGDAHVKRAAQAAVWGAFLHAGQACLSVERVLVHESVFAEFTEEAVRLTNSLRYGDRGWRDVGPLATRDGWEKAMAQLDEAVRLGAVVQTKGWEEGVDSPLFPPTVLTGVTPGMKIMQEETFAPVLPVMTFREEREAVRLANAVPYGLSASVFTKDRKRALRLARELETGSCSINNVIVPVSDVRLPFGGMKGSGFGRIRGREGLLAFCRTKTITRERGLAKSAVNWFPYRETAFPYMKAWLSRWYG